MKAIFNFITMLSLRFRWITLVLVILLLGLGTSAYTQMNQELLPPIEVPQTFILAQANGMTSRQVSTILTEQLEHELAQVEDIINIDSNTTGAFGATLIAYNDFGLNQQALQDEIRQVVFSAWHPDPSHAYSLDEMWLPLRGIAPDSNEDPTAFASRLLGDLTPETLMYIVENDANFLFQLDSQVWESLSDETVRVLAAHLASTSQESVEQGSALERLVSREISPKIVAIDGVAGAQTSGGQSLSPDSEQQESIGSASELLLLLSPDVWEIVATRFDGVDALDESAISTILAEDIEIPVIVEGTVPDLPASWQFPHFETPEDLLELQTITEPVATIFNEFYDNGYIIGVLGQVEDLTPNTISNMLALEAAAGVAPEDSLLQYFEAQHLLAMPEDVFDTLPDSYLDNLDEFTRSQLEDGQRDETVSVELPRQWQIPAPQLITFSFADIPLATYSIASTGEIVLEDEATDEASAPALPITFQQLGEQFGMELNDADDLLNLELPEEFGAVAQSGEFGAAELLNLLASPMLQTMIPQDDLPEGTDASTIGTLLLSSLNQDILNYLEANDPDFMGSLSENAKAAIFGEATSDGGVPGLNPQWGTVAAFNSNFESLTTSDDLINFPDDFAYDNVAALVNELLNDAGGRGFAPELLGNWSPASIAYILEQEPTALDGISEDALRLLPEDAISLLPDDLRETAEAVRTAIIPTTQVTRTNRQESLLFVIRKDKEANTVTTFHAIDEVINEIDTANDNIEIEVVEEQSSFVEESIDGVAREGGLGAVFAIIIILIFLSSGVWGLRGRRLSGMVITVVFVLGLLGLVVLNLDTADGWGEAFSSTDIVFRVLLITGIIGGLAVLFYPGDLPDPAWRATIVIAVSIPLSIMTAFAMMHWLSPAMYDVIQPLSENEGFTGDFFTFVLRLFPAELTLNLMTLSGLTVAVGRVVDDSIVVLENIFRQLQAGGDKTEAILEGTRDVSAAIFVATVIAVVVFLPLGLTGGIIGAFFLPFGLAITYALAASFIVAITVVPALAYVSINMEDIPEDKDVWIADYYVPVLKWSLRSWKTKAFVIFLAFVSAAFGFFLFSQRPAAFLPNFGEPQIIVSVDLPVQGARITDTNDRVLELEDFLYETYPEEIVTVQTTVGGGGQSFESLFGGNRVQENRASVVISVDIEPDLLDQRTQEIREKAEETFAIEGSDETFVEVSAGSAAGDFGGFELVISGDPQTLSALDPLIKTVLENIEGITNVASNLPEQQEGQTLAEAEEAARNETLIRVNQKPALNYTAELETENTIGITQIAITELNDMVQAIANGEAELGAYDLTEEQVTHIQSQPVEQLEAISVSEGFQSQMQTEGFAGLFLAMGIATIMVVIILIFTFQSAVYWFAIVLSIVVAPVGAAVALTLTDRVLGISALIGLLMLLGLVVTNAVVLIDRVRSNRNERGMNLYDALVEAGGRRLRPILMTSLATIIALTPLAIGLSEGALIASELGTVVIGGVVSSTLLTLIVVPVMYSLMHPLHRVLSFGSEPDHNRATRGGEAIVTGD